jgi:hypothetical protein
MYTCFVFIIYDKSTCTVHFRDEIIQICCDYYEEVEDICVGEYNMCVGEYVICFGEYDICVGGKNVLASIAYVLLSIAYVGE